MSYVDTISRNHVLPEFGLTIDGVEVSELQKTLNQFQTICEPTDRNYLLEKIECSLRRMHDKHIDRMEHDSLSSFERIYCFILTNGRRTNYSEDLSKDELVHQDPYMALDIIKRMADREDEPTIKEILLHPFHWNDFFKVHFICQAFEYISAEQKKTNSQAKNDTVLIDQTQANTVISGDDWIELLHLRQAEIKRIRRVPVGVTVDNDHIYKKALNSGESDAIRKKRGKSVYELMRFFRNRFVHRFEDKTDVKVCFGSYPEGYLRFFTSRYPMLFMHVYEKMKTFIIRDCDEFKMINRLPFFTK